MLAVSPVVIVASPRQAVPRAQGTGTALDRYVAAPDSNFSWKVLKPLPAEGVTATLLEMTSQKWLTEQEVERPLWTHWLTVVRPQEVKSDVALLFITGGSLERQPPSSPPAWLVNAARDTGTMTAELRLVPNQPVVFKDDPTRKPRTEDDFIAYTWDKFLRTGDEKWPARLPMTKSAVRAMDAVTQFAASADGGGQKVARFVVSGASKRGWTTWTTAAVDKRVIAIVPAVIDMLNVEPSFIHHYRAYGAWSDAVKDYTEQGIMDWMGTPQFRALMKIEEPYRVPGSPDDSQADVERVGRSVLPAGFVAVLFRRSQGREARALRAERLALDGEDRRARDRSRVLCGHRRRHAAARDQVDLREGRIDQGRDETDSHQRAALAGHEPERPQLPAGRDWARVHEYAAPAELVRTPG